MAGDVATARTAGPDVTQDLPAADDRVTSEVGMPARPGPEPTAASPADADYGPAPGETSGTGSAEGDGPASTEPATAGGRRGGPGRKGGGSDVKSAARSAANRVTRRTAQPGDSPASPQSEAAGGSGRSSARASTEIASGAAAVRRRLARLGPARGGAVNPVLEPLIKTVRTTHPKADIRLIERAYEVAARMHAGQSRNSGDPYITHPLAVATILGELGMPHDVISAALLHDTIEDTAYTIDQLREDFGDDSGAALITRGVGALILTAMGG